MLVFQERSRPHRFLSAILWTLSVVATLLAGAMAAMTTLMAASLDWGEAVAAGAAPWVDAAVALGEFLGVGAAAVLGMVAWHTQRFKGVALVLVAGAVLMTVWLLGHFVGEYT